MDAAPQSLHCISGRRSRSSRGTPPIRYAASVARAASIAACTLSSRAWGTLLFGWQDNPHGLLVESRTGDLEGANYEEVMYEGYGPGGVAVMVETMTDNRNRTVSEVRHAFTKHGGNLGENGSVSYLFSQSGHFVVDPESMSEEEFMEVALELDVADIATDRGAFEIFTDPSRYIEVKEALAEREVEVAEGQLAQVPSTWVELEGDAAGKALRMLDALEELDDVQSVWSNLDDASDSPAEA